MWLMDHQMNLRTGVEFGQQFQRIPLKRSPHIRQANALRIDWNDVLPPSDCSYVLGNPPFIGKQHRTTEQDVDMRRVFADVAGSGVLDYVCAWYVKAAAYIQGTPIRCAFVSTNSISQGEQPAILWGVLYSRYALKIFFGYRTFAWESEARGAAHVHVIIVGFAQRLTLLDRRLRIFDEPDSSSGTTTSRLVANINPYLADGAEIVVTARRKPISNVPSCEYGNKPADGGFLMVTDEQRATLLHADPTIKNVLKPMVSAEEFLNGKLRWCSGYKVSSLLKFVCILSLRRD